ncbi:hypothetical protein TNIN_9081 [Trichonephila inaurata madagascariensis]|uniref:Uncharacterized protein n=1 Tax=Trichonephila inaurata madagascariensis TaxID=2747483 RepID=A0A8X6XVS3_9ARAC|nr:hypothetical protein TNIN_9081 [Trichonephila inaurata madagascariensis]
MAFCVYRVKTLKANTLQPLPKYGCIMVKRMQLWHSLGSFIIVKGTMDQCKCASVLEDHVHPYVHIVFSQNDVIYQLTMRSVILLVVCVRGLKSTRMSLPFSPDQHTHLI